MRIIVDRFENNIAVVELPNGTMINCPKELIPDNAKEGNIISIMIDSNATAAKLKKNTDRMNKLFKD